MTSTTSTSSRSAEQLIEDSQGLVRFLAKQIHRRAPQQVELDDLIGYGQIGLAEAARDFDPSQNIKFTTFAYYRIRGAIHDGMYKMSWFSRRRHRELRYRQMANAALQAESTTESDGTLRGDSGWLQKMTGTLAVVYLATREPGGEEGFGERELVDESSRTPAALAAEKELVQVLHRLIDELPEDSAALVRATYFEGLTLQDAGERLGISKSWASRLHARALEQLARALRGLGVEECQRMPKDKARMSKE
jgi:RNA polymerase sigma factor for flagellar operon FliA